MVEEWGGRRKILMVQGRGERDSSPAWEKLLQKSLVGGSFRRAMSAECFSTERKEPREETLKNR